MEDFELFGNLYSPLIILFLIPRATSTSSPYLRTYLLRSFIRCPLLLRLCFICLFQSICIVHRLTVRLFAFFSLLLFSISLLPLFPHSYGTAAITYLAGRSILDVIDIASPDHLTHLRLFGVFTTGGNDEPSCHRTLLRYVHVLRSSPCYEYPSTTVVIFPIHGIPPN